VSDVDGLRRLRLYYLYPREIRSELIDEMASNPLVADYFDLSLQHASGTLLRAMKRPGSGERHLDLITRIREAAPDAALRSSFIVGFPGETEDDVDELAEFLEAARLDWAGFFPFSPEEGTPAAGFDHQVDGDEKAARLRHLQEIQEDVTTAANLAQRGSVVEVLVDQVEDGQAVGRSYRQAPEIDGVTILDRGAPGDWLKAEITGGYGIDLSAVIVGNA
jgi:tRNA A37 methylthiotransferase MiaB